MVKANKTSTLFKSYGLLHKANPNKVDLLFNLYKVYNSEYQFHVTKYWSLFTHNKIKNNRFSHLGSTKDIKTSLNASYLQICLSQSCSILNNHLANIKTKFTEIVNNSSIKDKQVLHQLRTINSKHNWLGNNLVYYTMISRFITDDYGNLVEVKEKKEILIDKNVIRLARIIYNQIIEKQRVRFPNLNKPRLLIDDRLYSLEKTKFIKSKIKNKSKNFKTSTFDYWLKISTLESGKRILIPIKSNQYFENSGGIVGNTIELDFKHFDYQVIQHKHNSLNKPKNKNGLTKSNRQLNFVFNKKLELDEAFKGKDFENIIKDKSIAFDLGLCNLIATSEGQLLGKYWLKKLTYFDKRIQELASIRQSLGLKTRSKKYDGLIKQVKGFIKTEINRLLNSYFAKHQNIQTVAVEKLNFRSPDLSARLNRIIQNFGYSLFKAKLDELSLFYGFTVEEFNPAYTSQECHNCGYVDKNNRASQANFECLCCKTKLNADVQGSRVVSKRFRSQQSSTYKSLYKGIILRKLKLDFVKGIDGLLSQGKIGRRNLYNLLQRNNYFKYDLKEIVKTTSDSGLDPMSKLNYEKYLQKYYCNLK